MKRCLLVGIVIAVFFASCSINVDSVDNEREGVKHVDPAAVCFNAYVPRGVPVKAGHPGVLTTDTDGTVKLKTAGFGVFGFYGNGALYDEILTPEFMYNQKVTYEGDNWSYSPMKFWPNEAGTALGSESIDRLSFFAYAPHVVVSSSTGAVEDGSNTGIIGLSSHSSQGDPFVKYSASLTPGKDVDLCWGLPFIDVARPTTNERIDFMFNHALAQLNVQIDTDIDIESHAESTLAPATHIYIRSVSFKGFTTRGSLNLNSQAGNPVWKDMTGTGVLRRDPITIYDGRADGLEGTTSGLNVNEVPSTLNPVLVQSHPYGSAEMTAGVTNNPVNLFDGPTATAPLMVIPVPGAPLTVDIVYDVETADNNMLDHLSDGATRGLSVENRISRTVQLMDGSNLFLSAGKKYVVNLHLGLTSVKFDATVGAWDDAGGVEPYVPPGPVTLGSAKFSQTQVTKWIGETITHPALLIRADDGSSMSGLSGLQVEWSSSDTNVATVDVGAGTLSIKDAGSTTIMATVTYEGVSTTASYTLNINKVSAVLSISSSDASLKMKPGEQKTLVATLDYTTNGSITSWPSVEWTSSNDDFGLDPARGLALYGSASTVVTAPNEEGYSDISLTIGSPYAVTAVTNTARVTSETALPTYRGYRVSKGFLKRETSLSYFNDESELTLAAIASQIHSSQSYRDVYKETYYHSLNRMKTELGSEDGIVNCSLIDLEGWTVPSLADWNAILFGTPKSETKVNGQIITNNAFFYVNLSGFKDGGWTFSNYRCLLLIPDGVNIELEGTTIVLGANSGVRNTAFLNLAYNDSSYKKLINDYGCLLIPCATSYITSTGGKPPMQNTLGYFRTSSSKVVYMQYSDYYQAVTLTVGSDMGKDEDFYPVKLVKKVE